MKLTILKDSKIAPSIFQWLGKIEKSKFMAWLNDNELTLPDDLKEFLMNTGGGTAFETEEFLCPINTPDYLEDFLSVNKSYIDAGLPKSNIIFHTGLALSAVISKNQKFVLLDKITFEEIQKYNSFEEWYLKTIRFEYAERYGLPIL
jgi:hypothetical protein